jgi:hypothetical protein
VLSIADHMTRTGFGKAKMGPLTQELSTQKPKIRDKPQITQISQMAEAKEFGCGHRKEFVRNKNEDSRDPVSSFFNLRNLWFQIRNLGSTRAGSTILSPSILLYRRRSPYEVVIGKSSDRYA